MVNVPSATINAAVLNQDTEFSTVAAVQPLTALLKVRAGIKAAKADEEIAQAQLEKGRRELISGTEQLFWGLLAVQRIRAGAAEALAGAEKMAAAPNAPVEVRLALVEGRQALKQVENQLADLQEQMDLLLDLPTCTRLELVEPSRPGRHRQVCRRGGHPGLGRQPGRARGGTKRGPGPGRSQGRQGDYLPNVAIVGGYANQTGEDYIQPNIGYVGVQGATPSSTGASGRTPSAGPEIR